MSLFSWYYYVVVHVQLKSCSCLCFNADAFLSKGATLLVFFFWFMNMVSWLVRLHSQLNIKIYWWIPSSRLFSGDETEMALMSEKAIKAARPDASTKIAEHILSLAKLPAQAKWKNMRGTVIERDFLVLCFNYLQTHLRWISTIFSQFWSDSTWTRTHSTESAFGLWFGLFGLWYGLCIEVQWEPCLAFNCNYKTTRQDTFKGDGCTCGNNSRVVVLLWSDFCKIVWWQFILFFANGDSLFSLVSWWGLSL